MKVLVSVIMPARNVEKYVDEAIRSVLEQRGTVFELLVADDASTDGTWDRIQACRPNTKMRTWRFREHKGVGAARNYLIAHARGRYLAFCDADDKMLPGLLRALCLALDRNPQAGVAYTDRLVNDSSGRLRLRLRSRGPVETWDLIEGTISNGGAIVRRSLIKKVGGFRQDLSYLEDCELFWRLAEVTRFVYVKGKPLYFYRQRPGSLTEQFKKKASTIQSKLLREIIKRRYGIRVRWPAKISPMPKRNLGKWAGG